MDHIRFNDRSDGEAIAKLAGTDYNPNVNVSFCRVRDGVRLGGVVFSGYTHESIGIHSGAWAPRWINRDMLFVTFDYPFNQLGVKRLFGQVPETNHHALEFNFKLGFRVVARIEGVFPDNVACIVMRMDREDCRMLSVKPRNMVSNKVAH
jgi:RimJ/RimL family protein N-acetyltransferase